MVALDLGADELHQPERIELRGLAVPKREEVGGQAIRWMILVGEDGGAADLDPVGNRQRSRVARDREPHRVDSWMQIDMLRGGRFRGLAVAELPVGTASEVGRTEGDSHQGRRVFETGKDDLAGRPGFHIVHRAVAQVPRSDGRQDRDFLPAERLGRDHLRPGGSGTLPCRHHAGCRARRSVKVFERVRSSFECDRPLVPGIAHRAMGSGRGRDFPAVDDQEAAILAGREELVVTGRADPQGAGIEAQERLGAGCQRVEAMEDVRDVNTADRLGRGECLAHGAGLVEVAGLPAAGLQHQAEGRGPRGRLAGGALAAVVDGVASLPSDGLERDAAEIARADLKDAPGHQLVPAVEHREVLPACGELAVREELGDDDDRLRGGRRHANVPVVAKGSRRGGVGGFRLGLLRGRAAPHLGGQRQPDGRDRPATKRETAEAVHWNWFEPHECSSCENVERL